MSPWPGSASVDVCRRGAKVDTTSMGAWSRSSRSTQYPLVTASVRTPGRHTNWPGTSVHWYVPSRAYNTKGRSHTEQIWPWKQQQWVERKKAGTQNTLTCHIPGFVLKSPFKIHKLFTNLRIRPLLFISLLHSDNQSETTANFYNSSKVDVGECADTDFVRTEIWPDWFILDAHRLSNISCSFTLCTEKEASAPGWPLLLLFFFFSRWARWGWGLEGWGLSWQHLPATLSFQPSAVWYSSHLPPKAGQLC